MIALKLDNMVHLSYCTVVVLVLTANKLLSFSNNATLKSALSKNVEFYNLFKSIQLLVGFI